MLRTEGEEPDLPKILLLAPTGTAAFNIEGITIHTAFLLQIKNLKKKKEKQVLMNLSQMKKETLLDQN